jgi:hypothetical protein
MEPAPPRWGEAARTARDREDMTARDQGKDAEDRDPTEELVLVFISAVIGSFDDRHFLGRATRRSKPASQPAHSAFAASTLFQRGSGQMGCDLTSTDPRTAQGLQTALPIETIEPAPGPRFEAPRTSQKRNGST